MFCDDGPGLASEGKVDPPLPATAPLHVEQGLIVLTNRSALLISLNKPVQKIRRRV